MSYIGLRISNQITHFENRSEQKGHTVISKGNGWDSLIESVGEVQKAKRNIINYTYLPLRKLEEIYWNIIS